MYHRGLLTLLAVCCALVPTDGGLAETPLSHQGDGKMGTSIQPLDRILPKIRRSHPGEFYDADGPIYGPSGDAHYHLKWMTADGKMVWFDVDARTGLVLRSSSGRDTFHDK